MAFRFGQRRVADPLAQQNFEQLEGMFPIATDLLGDGAAAATKTKLDVVKTGTVTGNGAGIAVNPAYSNLFTLSYTTPDVPMQGVLYYSVTITNPAAAWMWAYTRMKATTGTEDLHLPPSTNSGSSLKYLHSAGQAGAIWNGLEYVQLKASTSYVWTVQATSSGNNLWTPQPSNYALGVFWAR
jgi:hypothetical protein